MKIEGWKYTGVKPDGTFKNKDAGAIETKPEIRMSTGQYGDYGRREYWIMIATARTKKGVASGVTAYFDNKKEMARFFKTKEMHGKMAKVV